MGVEYNFPNISSQSLEIVPEPGVFKQKKKMDSFWDHIHHMKTALFQ